MTDRALTLFGYLIGLGWLVVMAWALLRAILPGGKK